MVAAVIERDGYILICQRKRGSRHELKWEFPGGKIESGETPQKALARELREELAIEALIGEEMADHHVQYPGGPPIHLRFYRVTAFSAEPQNLDFEEILWERRERLVSHDFLEGDLAFIASIAAAAG